MNQPLDRLTLYRLRLPLRTPWHTAYGTETAVETLYARAESGSHTAWFESCPLRFPDYTPECAASAFAVLCQHLIPLVLGSTGPKEVADRLAPVRGNPFARNLLDGCAWQLAALAVAQPLQQLLGGRDIEPAAGITIAAATPPDLRDEILAANPGRRIRCKFTGTDALPAIRELRAAVPTTAIWLDCNGALKPTDRNLLAELDDLGLQLIEQPLHYRDLVGHARLRQQWQTPIALDESITCPEDAATAISIGAAQVFNLKPGRVGGISSLVEILQMAAAANIDCFIGGMLETDLGGAVNRILATLPGITLPSDLPAADRHFADHPGPCPDETAVAPFVIESASFIAN